VVERDRSGVVAAPMPAVVQRILVQQGDAVEAGQQLLVLEAMKLEAPVVAPQAGRVDHLFVSASQQVARDAPLLTIAPGDQAAAEEIREQPVPAGARAPAAEVRRLLLGYDDDGWSADALAAALQGAAEDSEGEDAELEALSTFAALAALFRRGHDGDARPPFEDLLRYLRTPEARGEGLPAPFLALLDAALLEQGASRSRPSRDLDLGLLRLWKARHRIEALAPAALGLLQKRLGQARPDDARWRGLLERLVAAAHASAPAIADLARELRFAWFDRPLFQEARDQVLLQAQADLRRLTEAPDPEAARRLMEVTWPLSTRLIETMVAARPAARGRLVEVLLRRYFRLRNLEGVAIFDAGGLQGARAEYAREGLRFRLLACFASTGRAREVCRQLARAISDAPADVEIALELYLCDLPPSRSADDLSTHLREGLEGAGFARPIRRAACVVAGGDHAGCFTFRPTGNGYAEERHLRGVHPMLSKRLQLDRLANFELTRLPGAEDVYLFHGRARENPRDERFFALAEVRDLTPLRDEHGRIVHLPQLEHVLHQAFTALRLAQARRPGADRLEWNRILLTIPAPFTISREETMAIARRLAPETEGLGLEMALLSVRVPQPGGAFRDVLVRIYNSDQQGVHIRWDEPATRPLLPLGDYQQRVVQLRRRGLPYAYEVVKLFTPSADASQGDFPPGDFAEHDLDEAGALAPVERPPGKNSARIVAGVLRNFTPRYPEGMKRVVLLGDASREMGALAEPECRRIVAAIDLAERLHVPLEWFALSAGAQISLESGTENMDWVARALRRIVLFTQAGGEINVVVAGINVGAQPYWNAEATMLMHARGILIMTPASAMVLTGKQALEYSGGVSAEDNQGIGGYDRIMGPNGQAQYWAPDLPRACALLLRHYEHTWVAPGERFPRRASSDDPRGRDISPSPHPQAIGGFATVGEVFSAEKNPDRKKPFEIRAVMAAVADSDHAPLERWRDLRHGKTAVVWDAHLGGQPVCLLGVQSQTLPRAGFIPADGPDAWSGGTLFPLSSKKIARALNAASGNRPVVVLANLSGFDGSPESMRRLQLEYGAEIGRAVVNFDGPIVFCVVSRYHGGAFVVFSRHLRENMEVLAVEGARASVIGGAPAAAVVFTREVESRVRKDPRFAAASAAARARLRTEKMGEVAAEYDRVHTIERAVRVGSVERIVKPCDLRPALIDAVERGMARTRR
jgi:acetyl-CoA carboxylase carboxyltransferase component